ncbi:MAG: hypothetical protein AB1521_13420 [Bacteroidota bacterium]
MKRFFSTYLLFALSLSIYAQDNLSIQFDYANTLYKTGQYFDAITEFKRLLFFSPQKKYSYDANILIGKCYKAGAKFDDAIKYFSVAELNTNSAEQKIEAKFQIVRANILRRTTNRALEILNELEKEISQKQLLDSVNYWKGWSYIFADNWKEASAAFGKIKSNHELKKLCDQIENDKVSVTFTKVISYILPGSGQIYTGNILPGLMSFGWNILGGYLTVNSFVEDRVFDGAVIGSLIWLRFYRGNIQGAENSAIQKNIDISNKALRFLQFEYKGAKP